MTEHRPAKDRKDVKQLMEGYLIGIDVGGTNIKMMIMDGDYQVAARCSIPTFRNTGYDEISERIIRTLEDLMGSHKLPGEKLKAVAMGLPGTVDTRQGLTVRLSALHWDGMNPCEKIGRHFQIPYFIENDANINAFGEYMFGGNRDKNSLALVTLGTGVGCGIILDGKIAGGASNMAGELGHMIVNADGGGLCLCGKRGHLEAYCSGIALTWEAEAMMSVFPDSVLHRYRKEHDGVFDIAMITKGYEEGDPVCMELIDRYNRYLSVGLANLMTMYNPQLILVGGGISNAGDIILNPINKWCKEMVLSERAYCPVKRAALGSEAGMYGACALAGQKVGMEVYGRTGFCATPIS